MEKFLQRAALISLLGTMGLLAACNAQPPQPTVDANVIFTAAAQTVQAQLTVAAASQPTATPTQAPTEAPTLLPTVAPAAANPTAEGIPTLSIMLTPGTTPVAITTPLVVATLPPVATAAPAQDVVESGEIVDQDPDDGTVVSKDQDFDMTWAVKNTGTTTWTPGTGNCEGGYYIAYGGGDRIGAGYSNWYCLRNKVAPGETSNITIDMHTSTTSGKYYSWWCLMNSQKKCIRIMDVTLNVE